MDHSAHRRLELSELTQDNLIDAAIYGPGNEKIGSVSHLHGSGADAEIVVDLGGFLGIGARPVALAVSELDFMRGDDGGIHVTTSLTRDQVVALPEHRDDEQAEGHTYVRPAGRKKMDIPPGRWSKIDEEIDESFPASDPPGNY
jgi:hypothetical protein